MPKVGIGQFQLHLSVATILQLFISRACKQATPRTCSRLRFNFIFPMNFNHNMENLNPAFNPLFTNNEGYQDNSSSDEIDSGSEHEEDSLRQVRYEVGSRNEYKFTIFIFYVYLFHHWTITT